MNKKIILVLGALLLLIIGGFILTKTLTKSKSGNGTSTISSPIVQSSNQGTLRSIFESGKSQKCTFDNKTANSDTKTTGTVYVSNGKVKGDFEGSVGGNAANSHVILDSQTMYVWTDMSKEGFKFALTQADKASTSGKAQGPDLNQTVDYSCQNWTPDDSLFILPSDITFSNFTIPSPIPSGANGGDAGMSLCSICDQITDAKAKENCKVQYSCK